MTIINQKSISGITSITFASAGDDLLTFHSNNGTERFRIDNSGNTKITAGIVTTLTVTGDVDVADKIVHTGDTNTAIRFPAADTFTVETGGSERVRVDSSGNFGVGTNSPNAGLNVGLGGNTIPVAGASTGSALFSNAQDGNAYGLVLGATSGGAGYIAAQRADGVSTTYNLIMQPNGGSIGVGTDSPTSQSGKTLHLHNGGGQQRLHLTTNNSGSEAGKGLDIILEHNTDGDAHILNHNTNGDLKLGAGDAERIRILSGGGLTFNGDTAATNALDDYEEGTFTPTAQGSTTAGTATYSQQVGKYTKIGDRVFFEIYIHWDSGTGSGSALYIYGLPFTAQSSSQSYPATTIGYFHNISFTANSSPGALVASGSTYVYFYAIPNGGGSNAAIAYDSAGAMIISGHYKVN